MTNPPKSEEEYEDRKVVLVAAMQKAEADVRRAERAHWDAQQAVHDLVDGWALRDRCAAMVNSSDGWDRYRCTRRRGHGPREAYCKQHAELPGRWTKEDREASR